MIKFRNVIDRVWHRSSVASIECGIDRVWQVHLTRTALLFCFLLIKLEKKLKNTLKKSGLKKQKNKL